jgi:bifunctional non-homologous end joining protein LigD
VADEASVVVEGRTLRLTNLGKPLYPDGFTKGEVVDYYSRIAPVLLPHLRGRPATFVRFPNGTDGMSFFEKNASRGRPDWVRTVRLPAPGSSKDRGEIDYALVEDLPTLVWAANLAALELHVPQWRVGPRGGVHPPDLVVVDLDPGPPATIVECCQVALRVRDRLGPGAVAKTSGSKGLQLYARWEGGDPREAMHALARELEAAEPELVVSRMTKSLRGGKVLFDWSQNNTAKTTVAPYSLRGRPRPTVSTPVTWEEVEACADPADLVFTAPDVLARVARHGDLFAGLAE